MTIELHIYIRSIAINSVGTSNFYYSKSTKDITLNFAQKLEETVWNKHSPNDYSKWPHFVCTQRLKRFTGGEEGGHSSIASRTVTNGISLGCFYHTSHQRLQVHIFPVLSSSSAICNPKGFEAFRRPVVGYIFDQPRLDRSCFMGGQGQNLVGSAPIVIVCKYGTVNPPTCGSYIAALVLTAALQKRISYRRRDPWHFHLGLRNMCSRTRHRSGGEISILFKFFSSANIIRPCPFLF